MFGKWGCCRRLFLVFKYYELIRSGNLLFWFLIRFFVVSYGELDFVVGSVGIICDCMCGRWGGFYGVCGIYWVCVD